MTLPKFDDIKKNLAQQSIAGFWLPVVVLGIWLLAAFFAPLLALDPNKVDLHQILQLPGSSQILGNDDLGRPIFDRVLLGAKTSFIVAIWVILLSSTMGVCIGLFSGYLGGWLDRIVVIIIDVFLAFPGILLAIALAGIMGPGIENVVFALSVVGWVGFARLTRAQVLSVRQRDHVLAATALGSNTFTIVTKHLLPLIMAPVIVEASFGVASIVIAEAGLSFLGLGVQPPEASWGAMIRDGTRYILVAPHMVLIPGLALMAVVLSVNLLGDRLRDYLDVRSRFNR